MGILPRCAAPGTIREVAMSDLTEGADSSTEGQARARIEGAGSRDVTGLVEDGGGIWRGPADREGRTFDIGFDDEGQVAFP